MSCTLDVGNTRPVSKRDNTREAHPPQSPHPTAHSACLRLHCDAPPSAVLAASAREKIAFLPTLDVRDGTQGEIGSTTGVT
jgi:hypothetical protein